MLGLGTKQGEKKCFVLLVTHVHFTVLLLLEVFRSFVYI